MFVIQALIWVFCQVPLIPLRIVLVLAVLLAAIPTEETDVLARCLVNGVAESLDWLYGLFGLERSEA